MNKMVYVLSKAIILVLSPPLLLFFPCYIASISRAGTTGRHRKTGIRWTMCSPVIIYVCVCVRARACMYVFIWRRIQVS